VEEMVKKELVLGILIFSLILFGCAPQPASTNESVFVSFFNESLGNVSKGEPAVVVIENEEPANTTVPVESTSVVPENTTERADEGDSVPPVTGNVPIEVPNATEPQIPVKEYIEGDLVKLNVKAVDPDNDNLLITYSSPLSENGTWQTKEGDAGQYKVEISVSDGTATLTKEVLLIIDPKNKPPVIDIDGEITVSEGETVTLAPVVSDADNDPVTVTYTGWMTEDTYKTGYEDAGSYIVTIIASDGKTSVAKDVKVNVQNVNRPPVIEPIQPMRVTEGDLVKVNPVVTDQDNDQITITYGAPLNDEGEWQTVEGDAGDYEVTVSATDGIAVVTQSLKITVIPLNRPPVIQRIQDISVKEGEPVTIEPVIIDPDGDSFTVGYSGWMTSNTKATGYDDAGSYIVTVTATDNKGASSSVDVKIIVENVNRPPEVEIE